MFAATLPAPFLQVAELVTSFGLTLFLQTGVLIGLGLLASRWVRKKGAAPLSTLFRLTLVAVAICPPITLAWHVSGFRLQPFELPWSSAQVTPAPLPSDDASLPPPSPWQPHPVAMRPMPRDPARPAVMLPADGFGDVPLPAGPRISSKRELRATSAVEAEPRKVSSISSSATFPFEADEDAQDFVSHVAPSPTWVWLFIVFAVGWPAVSMVLLGRLAFARSRMMRICREAKPAPDPVQTACARLAEDLGVKAPRVLITPYAPAPCLLGIRSPVILYPAGERATTVEVLCHELAHLARNDCLWFLVGHIVQAILFFQPLLQVLIRRFERASDDVCDDLVLEYSSHRRRYARELVRIAQIHQVRHDQLLAALGAVSFRSRLGKRIERIVDTGRSLSPRTRCRDRMALTVVAFCCTLVIALFQVGAAPAVAVDENPSAVAEPLAFQGATSPEESTPASLALRASLSEKNTISTPKAARRPASWDPVTTEAMRTRVNSWLASAASAVRQTANTQTDEPVENQTPEQPSSEPEPASVSSQPAEDTRAATAADESVGAPPDDNNRGVSLSNLKRVELQGTVYDNDGRLAADTDVWAYPSDENYWQMIESKTDADGRFKLDLTRGNWRVVARKNNRFGAANNAWGLVGVTPSNTPEPCIIKLTPGGTLRGQLLDKESGEPIRYGRVWIDDCGLVQADENGRYEVRGLALDAHHMVTMCPGYYRGYLLLDTSLRQVAELDLRLSRGGRITGRVVDEQGRPIPGASCGNFVSSIRTVTPAQFEPCNENGEFVWDGAACYRPTPLQATAFGYASEEKRITVVRGADSPHVEFRLKREAPENDKGPMRSITGVVRTSDGKAVRAARVCFHYNYVQPRRFETTTDAGGRFALRRVPDQTGYLTVTARNHSPTFASIIRPGNLDGELVLDSGRTIRGRVQDANGEPREGIMVLPVAAASPQAECTEPWVWQLHTVTDKNGQFELHSCPQDGFRYDFFDAEGNRTSRIDLQDNAVITMAGPGAFRGRVIDPEGKPVRDFRILLSLTDCEPTRPTFQSPSVNGSDPNAHTTGVYAGLAANGVMYTSADGTFVLSGVAATNINTVIAEVPGYGRAVVDCVHARVREKLGAPEELTLHLTRPHQLRVRVVQESAPDQPVVAASVGLVPYGSQAGASYRHPAPYFQWGYSDCGAMLARTDEKGWASFPGLSLDEGTVIVQAKGFARESLEWRAEQPEKPDITVRLKPECVITGVLKDPSGGRPLRDFRANLERGDYKDYSKNPKGEISKSGAGTWSPQEYFHIQVGPAEKGQFRFSGLPAGRYLLVVQTSDLERPPHQFYREEFMLSEGESHEIDTVASKPVPLDPWNRPVTAASRNGTFFPKRGGMGFMAGFPSGERPGGR